MRPARPVVCEPAEVSAPVIGCVPSRNIGSGTPLFANVVAVVVSDNAFRVVPLLRLTACSTVPEGFARPGPGIELRPDRTHASREVDADDLIVCTRGRVRRQGTAGAKRD